MFATNGVRRHVAISTLSLAIMLVVAACGGATASVAPSATPTPAATPTAAPTPSPTPVDVAAAFTRIASAPDFSAVGKIAGTVKIGPVDGEISGDGLFDGADSSGSTTLTAGTFKEVTHSVTVGSESWTRKEPGPWLVNTSATAGEGLDDYLRSVGTVVDLGVETYAGRELHHLQPMGGNKAAPEALGFDVSGATDAAFTVDLYATDDGTPAIMAVTGSWTTVSGDQSIPTSMTFDLVFSDIGKPQTITAPEDVWVRFTSSKLGYTMAHPALWTVESEKDQDAYLVNGQGYVYVAIAPFKGSTATFVSGLKAAYKKPFEGDPKSETPTRLGGEAAIRLIYQFTNDSDQAVTVADDVVSRDGTGWEVYLVTAGGPEDVAVFDQFVATFEFTE
jgi:hypothetical protein